MSWMTDMRFLNELKTTSDLSAAVQANNELRAKAAQLAKQMNDQRGVVNKLSNDLDQLLEAQRQDTPQTPEEVLHNKRKCVEVSAALEEEQEFLAAINEAHLNILLDAETKGRYIKNKSEGIIADSGKQAQPKINAEAGPVLDALLVSWLAQHGLIGNPIEAVMRDMSVMLHNRSQNLVLPLNQIQAAKTRLLKNSERG
jgi:hypothetical protein